MRRTLNLGFPPFTRAVKWLLIANFAVFVLMAFLHAAAPLAEAAGEDLFWLIPGLAVQKLWLWQLVTYAFFHAGILHIFFNMLMLWMFGATLEMDWGQKKFLEFYFLCVVGAALLTIAVSYSGLLGITPLTATLGASGGIYGILLAFGMLYGEQEVFLFPFPFTIKAKYMVAGLIIIALYGALHNVGGIANFAHLGGALAGLIYLKTAPRRGLGHALSERYYGLRNFYYRWKRRRAARKFEVYMRKHDRSEFFDEHGNFRDPTHKEKGDGDPRSSRGGWVN